MKQDLLLNCTPVEAAQLLFPVVDDVVRNVVMPIAQKRDPSRTGGSFVCWRAIPGVIPVIPLVGFSFGEVSVERIVRYCWFANEKSSRLSQLVDDISSWESRDESDADPMKHKYGGAVKIVYRDGELYFSFSGFSEHEDEMVSEISAHRLELVNINHIREVIRVSKNRLLYDYFQRTLPRGSLPLELAF